MLHLTSAVVPEMRLINTKDVLKLIWSQIMGCSTFSFILSFIFILLYFIF